LPDVIKPFTVELPTLDRKEPYKEQENKDMYPEEPQIDQLAYQLYDMTTK